MGEATRLFVRPRAPVKAPGAGGRREPRSKSARLQTGSAGWTTACPSGCGRLPAPRKVAASPEKLGRDAALAAAALLDVLVDVGAGE